MKHSLIDMNACVPHRFGTGAQHEQKDDKHDTEREWQDD